MNQVRARFFGFALLLILPLVILSVFFSSFKKSVSKDITVANFSSKSYAASLSQLIVDSGFTFAIIPDTQFYSSTYPKIFTSQTNWIASNKNLLNIKYAIHMGDIVDTWSSLPQWKNANASMSVLDNAGVPYGILAGNHDNSSGSSYTQYSANFGVSRFSNKPWFGGASAANNAYHYDLVNAGNYKFLVMYISYDKSADLPMEWIKKTISANSDKTVILVAHAYLDSEGNMLSAPDSAATIKNLALQYSNIKMVLSGHKATSPGSIVHNTIKNGTVHQIVQDYQKEPNGGNGWLNLFTFFENGKVTVNTYSPYLDKYGASFSFDLAASPVADPVAYWKFDENTGASAANFFGNGNTAFLNNTKWIAGKVNSAVSFNGTTSYAKAANSPSLNITGPITLEAWVKPAKLATAYIIKKASLDSVNGYELSLSETGKAFFRLNQKTSRDAYKLESISSYPTSGATWIHIAGVYNGFRMKIYIDGRLEKTIAGPLSIASNTDALEIGGFDNSEYFSGGIDEIKIYNRALSDSEVLADYNSR